jgi:site-specific DNA recombinase
LQPTRLEQLLSHMLDRRTERAERRKSHIAELRKRAAAEADAKLKRLYDAIENGVADLSDPLLKDRIGELKATRDQVRLDAQRAQDAIERAGPAITPQALKTFASTARKRLRADGGGYRREHLRALAQRVEVDQKELRIWDRKARSCAPSSLLKAQKRQVLACPVLCRSGAPEEIRTPASRFIGQGHTRGSGRDSMTFRQI